MIEVKYAAEVTVTTTKSGIAIMPDGYTTDDLWDVVDKHLQEDRYVEYNPEDIDVNAVETVWERKADEKPL